MVAHFAVEAIRFLVHIMHGNLSGLLADFAINGCGPTSLAVEQRRMAGVPIGRLLIDSIRRALG